MLLLWTARVNGFADTNLNGRDGSGKGAQEKLAREACYCFD